MPEGKDDNTMEFVKAAFQWQYNWIALAGAAGFALVSGSALPLILGAGIELIYLSTVPQNARFRRLVRSWKYDEDRRRREKSLSTMFHELPPHMRVRYAALEATCKSIRENYGRLTADSQIFVEQMQGRLEGLLQSYVRLLHSAFQHREYLGAVNPESIRKERAHLQQHLKLDPPKVQEINSKRIEILGKRLEKYEKIRENTQVVDAQCAAIEDVLELIRDQSVTMRDPRQISDHLESLVKDVEHTEENVREMESILELSPLAAEMDSGAASRTRVRS